VLAIISEWHCFHSLHLISCLTMCVLCFMQFLCVCVLVTLIKITHSYLPWVSLAVVNCEASYSWERLVVSWLCCFLSNYRSECSVAGTSPRFRVRYLARTQQRWRHWPQQGTEDVIISSDLLARMLTGCRYQHSECSREHTRHWMSELHCGNDSKHLLSRDLLVPHGIVENRVRCCSRRKSRWHSVQFEGSEWLVHL